MSADEDKRKEDELLLRHEYDGIQEFDNPMPRWWKWIFWGSFYFSILYFAHYHLTGNGESVMASWESDVAAAREAQAQLLLKDGGPSEEKLLEFMTDSGLMADASQLFVQRCAQCHGNEGEGKIGPNLTDEYWLHGSASLMDIYQAVDEGFTAKGMPAWGRQLRPVEVMKLAAFVGSLRNTQRQGRAPEGVKIALLEAEGAGDAHPERQPSLLNDAERFETSVAVEEQTTPAPTTGAVLQHP